MLVVGNREVQVNRVSVRLRTNKDRSMTDLSGFVDHLHEVVEKKSGL